jgi:hypothetical protein
MIGGFVLEARDEDDNALFDGGVSLIVCEGASSSNNIRVTPPADEAG